MGGNKKMPKKKKKKWEIPTLVCLYRGRPEEMVLLDCRAAGRGGPDVTGCMKADFSRRCNALTLT